MIPFNAALVEECWEPLLVLPSEPRQVVGRGPLSALRSEGQPGYLGESLPHLLHHRAPITAIRLTDIPAMATPLTVIPLIDIPLTVIRVMDIQATRVLRSRRSPGLRILVRPRATYRPGAYSGSGSLPFTLAANRRKRNLDMRSLSVPRVTFR